MYLIANGKVITRDDAMPYIENGGVVVEGTKIIELGETAALKAKYPDAEFIDAKGNVIMPAFINVHSHIYSALARGLSIKGYNPTNFYEILDGMWWAIDRNLDLEGTRYSAYTTFIDSIKTGCTTLFDHHASFCEIPGSLFTIEEVAKELGVRACLCYEVSDRDGEEKCRQAIHKLVKQHPGAFVVVTGCYAQLKPETVAKIEGVDVVLGAEQKKDLLHYLGNLQKHETGEAYTSALKDIRSFAPSCSRGDRTRFFLKVQDGCDYYCSYCTIPFARGRSRNGSIASMVEQASQAAAEGGKEIVLTGVNIGDFGKSTGETFFDLVKALDEVEGIERYRISSIEPNLLTDEIIEYVSRSRRFMPHFHIPLQSGSDEVLKLMRRRYDTALFASKIKKIKEVMPDSFIGVDVIVGTRGETEEYFGQAYEFIKSLDVTQLHVFSYSERPGTQALKIDHVVAPEEKHRRSQQLLELSDEKTRAFYARHIGQTMPVLLERPKPGLPMHGFTPNYIRVEVPHDAALDNQLVSVRLGDFNADGTALLGVME